MADLTPVDVRLAQQIGPAQRGLSDLGDHNAQPAWGAIEEVDIGLYAGQHRRPPGRPDTWQDGFVYVTNGHVYRVDGEYPDERLGP